LSLVKTQEVIAGDGTKRIEAVLLRTSVNSRGEIQDEISDYQETPEQLQVSEMILKHFILGTTTMYTPRVEFNDLSLVTRDQYDQMAFNTYQPNNGEPWEGAPQAAWRSRAIRPVIRNKCMSIAAHATARLIFPKIFAYNENSDEQRDAAQVMEDLMEWSGDESNYPYTALMRVITAMASPASIGYTEYGEVTRTVKTEKGPDGAWVEKRIRDEAYSCFMDQVVPVTQLYIQNMFEPDIQKQGWLIWRKVISYSEAQTKYNGVYENFKYVRPGVQTIYDDANRTFYYVYDPNMRQENVEEITYWNKNLDLKITMVNRVMLTPHDNPNPRMDKLYPFDKFGYEPIHNRFFYYKSLAFKLMQDANVVNTLYQMVIDGTYLAIFKPMVNVGGEIITSDVIVPGAVTTLSDPNADLRAINVGSDLRSGLETLSVVEKSIDESSQDPIQQGQGGKSSQTAYEISRLEQNANTVLGLFLQMIAQHVKDFGRLRLGDILQYLTAPEVVDITGEPELSYRTFFLKGAMEGANKKIEFDLELPDEMDSEDYLDASYNLLAEEKTKKMTIARVNPTLFRELKYKVTISPDVENPRSTDLERAYALEDYDRMIAQPMVFDPNETGKLLLANNPLTKSKPDKYLAKQPTPGSVPPQQSGSMPAPGNSPLAAMNSASPLSTGNTPTALPQLTR
jgi:hypothetical protein